MKHKRRVQNVICVLLTLVFAVSPLLTVKAADASVKVITAEEFINAIRSNDVDAFVMAFNNRLKKAYPDLADRVACFIGQANERLDSYEITIPDEYFEEADGNYHRVSGYILKAPVNDYCYNIVVTWITEWTDDPDLVGLAGVYSFLENETTHDVEYLESFVLPNEVQLHYRETYQNEEARQDVRLLKYAPQNYKLIEMKSSNERVAVINEDGIVTATGRGTAMISVTYQKTTTGSTFTIQDEVTVTFTTWQTIIWYFFFGFLWY